MNSFQEELKAHFKDKGVEVPEILHTCVTSDSTTLILENYTIQPRITSCIASTLRSPQICFRSITFNNLFLSEEGLKDICSALKHMTTLERLVLSGNGLRDEHHALGDLFSGCPNLEFFSFEWNKLCPHASVPLSASLLRHGKIRSLNFGNNLLTPDSVRDLFVEFLKKNHTLTNLDLSWNRLGNIGASVLLDALVSNMTLCGLSLKGNNVDHTLLDKVQEKLAANDSRRRELEQRHLVEEAAQSTVQSLRSRELNLLNAVRENEEKGRTMHQQLELSQKENSVLQAEVSSLRSQLSDMQKRQDESVGFYTQRESVLIKDKQSAFDAADQAHRQIANLQLEMEKITNDIKFRSEEHGRALAQRDSTIHELRRDLKDAHQQIEAVLTSQKQSNTDLGKTVSELNNIRQELMTKEARSMNLEEDVKRLNTDLKAKESHVSVLENRIQSANTQLQALQDRLSRSEDEKNQLRSECSQREVEVREKYSREKVDSDAQWAQRVRECEDNVRVKTKVIAELEKELESVRARHEKAMAVMEETRRNESEALAKAHLEIQRMQHAVSEAQSEKRRMEHSVSMSESRITTLTNEITDLQRQHQLRLEELSSYNSMKLREAEERVQQKANAAQEMERERTKALDDVRKMKEERRRFHEYVEGKVMESLHVTLSELRIEQ